MWNFKYANLASFINGYDENPNLWTRFGKIDSVQFSGVPDTQGNFAVLFCLQPGTRIRNLNRYSFTKEQFLNLDFSYELPGLALWLSQDPENRTTSQWDALSNEDKEDYTEDGLRLVRDSGFQPSWPNLQPLPYFPNIEVFYNGTRVISGGTLNISSIEGVGTEFSFVITNIGDAPLTYSALPSVLTSGSPTLSITEQPSSSSLVKEESDGFKLLFQPSSIGIFNGQVIITSNDPTNGSFVINIVGEGIAVPQGILQMVAVDDVTQSTNLEFPPRLVGQSVTRTLSFKNEGNYPIEISDIFIVNSQFTSNITAGTIDPGDLYAFDVTCDVNATGYIGGLLQFKISVSDGDTPADVLVNLVGYGI